VNTPSLAPEVVKRAAALAVSRYGLDRVRVGRALQTVLQAQGDGVSGDLLDMLILQRLLTPDQAEELRSELKDGNEFTQLELPMPLAPIKEVEKTPETRTPTTTEGPRQQPLQPTRSGYYLRHLGGNRLLRRLGEGGMGTVYLAYNEAEGSQVAIKVLADRLASNPAYVDRFLREAKNGTRLDHPNIVHCFAAGRDEHSGKHYIVMEYVDGPSARAVLDRTGPIAVGKALRLTLEIARALQYVHGHDFVHRDIKPDNILINSAGSAKLADLGLAKCIADASQLTGQKQGFGTPYYMPCEQAVDATNADARCDIYALGATLYHLITGEVPFPGETHVQVAERKLAGVFRPASSVNPKVPRALDRVLAKMLARNPEDRFQTAADLVAALERTGLAQDGGETSENADIGQSAQTTNGSSNEQTQLDLARPSFNATPPNGTSDAWFIRTREANGEWTVVRATVSQLIQQLRTGELDRSAEVSREFHGDFRPIAGHPAFKDMSLTPPPKAPPAVPELSATRLMDSKVPRAQTASSASRWSLVGTLLALILLGAGTALFYYFHNN
jgi:serine/threonine-protein kinase